MTVRIAPSLLSADFAHLAAEIAVVQEAGADLLHLDIMDGHFVPNLTFGPPLIRRLAAHCAIPMDAHLMVTHPDTLVPDLAAAGVSRVAVHVETAPHLHRTLMNIRDRGMSAGIAINPATAVQALADAIPFADFLLVMSVNPGFGGQAFIPQAISRIERLREMAAGHEMDISVDGGVGPENAAVLAAAGATTLIAGSEIFGKRDRAAAVADLRRMATGDN